MLEYKNQILSPGINIDIVFLVVDIVLLLLLLVGLDSGFVQKWWTEFKYAFSRVNRVRK